MKKKKQIAFIGLVLLLIATMVILPACKEDAGPEVIIETVTETVIETVEVENPRLLAISLMVIGGAAI